MSKFTVNEELKLSADSVYAKGGFSPRRKGQRFMHLYDLFPDFPNQQGEVDEIIELRANPIASVEFLGKFRGYDHFNNIIWYRAFSVTMHDGSRLAGFSLDADQYVMCLHTGYQRIPA